MKKIILLIVICGLHLCNPYNAQSQIRVETFIGGPHTLDSTQVDTLSRSYISSIKNLSVVFTQSYNLSIYSPSDTLRVKCGINATSTAGTWDIVYPGVPYNISGLSPMQFWDVYISKYSKVVGHQVSYTRNVRGL